MIAARTGRHAGPDCAGFRARPRNVLCVVGVIMGGTEGKWRVCSRNHPPQRLVWLDTSRWHFRDGCRSPLSDDAIGRLAADYPIAAAAPVERSRASGLA